MYTFASGGLPWAFTNALLIRFRCQRMAVLRWNDAMLGGPGDSFPRVESASLPRDKIRDWSWGLDGVKAQTPGIRIDGAYVLPCFPR